MLPRKYKLKKDTDFKKIFVRGRYFQEGFLRLKLLQNDLVIHRFGLIIGLKVSKKATQRNKLKRQIEEIIFDRLKPILNGQQPGFDVIIMVDPSIIEKNFQEIKRNLLSLIKKAGLIN